MAASAPVSFLFEANASWRVLAFFFENPSREEYVKALARVLKMSAGSVSGSCKALGERGFLKKKARGNALFYSLENENVVVKKLKTAWFLEKLLKFRRCWEKDEFVSVALYGSSVSGDFVEKSDADLLVVTNVGSGKASEEFRELREALAAERKDLSLTIMPLSKLSALARKRDRFYVELASNHILLWGASLVIA